MFKIGDIIKAKSVQKRKSLAEKKNRSPKMCVLERTPNAS